MAKGAKGANGRRGQDFTELFDTIEFPEAYRITYLGNAIVVPAYEAAKRDHGVIRPEYILLVCLSHFPELTAQDVARISGLPRNTISRAVHRVLSLGYIERAPDANDGRQAKLKITPAGRALHKKVAAYLKDWQEEVLGGLNEKERETLAALLRKAALHAASRDRG